MELFHKFQPPGNIQQPQSQKNNDKSTNQSFSFTQQSSSFGSNNQIYVNNNHVQQNNMNKKSISNYIKNHGVQPKANYTERSFQKSSYNNPSSTNIIHTPMQTINSPGGNHFYQSQPINNNYGNNITNIPPIQNQFTPNKELSRPSSAHKKQQSQKTRQKSAQNLADLKFIVSAMNNSYTSKLAGGQNVKVFDMMALVNKTVQQVSRFSMLKQGKIQDLKYYSKIVQVDQAKLFDNQSSFSMRNPCMTVQDTRQKYQLLIKLDGKQLKLQSLKNRNLHFNINFDTIFCQFQDYNQYENSNQYLIKFRVANKEIQLFVTQNSLPFGFNSNSNNNNQFKENADDYIFRSAREISKVLRKSIEKSRGHQFQLMDLIQRDNVYFKNNYATQEQFTQYCQSGDILLFKDNHTFAKIQRAITNSEYDHIAFVYRSDKYGICLVESSSGLGVGVTVWTHLVRHHWFKYIESISWRRLLIHQKPANFQKKVQQFVNANVHKKYGISLSKIFRFESKIKSQEQQKNRTYFCSQLVAQLYKKLGLLDQKVSSTQYWPKHFSDAGYIGMLNNSALEHQRILLFNQSILKQNYKGYK